MVRSAIAAGLPMAMVDEELRHEVERRLLRAAEDFYDG